jgi:tungstate transport system substrate-binding protein
MQLRVFLVSLLFIPLTGCLSPGEESTPSFRLGTTTSMRDSGLLDILVEEFEGLHQTDVEYVAVGTGAALQLGRTGDVDALIVHAPDQEATFIEEGYASERLPFAYNAFVMLSPVDLSGSIYDAFESIVSEEHCFISRGDDSGTHAKEQTIWRHLNETRNLEIIEDSNGLHPPGDWYYSIGQGMGAAINMADEKSCITLSDRGTALQFQEQIDLQRYEYDDPLVANTYSFLIVSQTNVSLAHDFQAYLLTEGRNTIANYTINGEAAFFVYD